MLSRAWAWVMVGALEQAGAGMDRTAGLGGHTEAAPMGTRLERRERAAPPVAHRIGSAERPAEPR